MKRVDELGALNRAGKRLALLLAPLTARPGVARVLGLLEAFAAVLQGKGSGSGWDMRGEIAVAARLITRTRPVIFDSASVDTAAGSETSSDDVGAIPDSGMTAPDADVTNAALPWCCR